MENCRSPHIDPTEGCNCSPCSCDGFTEKKTPIQPMREIANDNKNDKEKESLED